MRNAPSARIILTTVATIEEANKLASALVERELAACVNIVPGLTSIYRWQGGIEEASETLLIVKTTSQHLPALEDALRELHSYEVPELLAINVESAGQAYLDWLMTSLRPSTD